MTMLVTQRKLGGLIAGRRLAVVVAICAICGVAGCGGNTRDPNRELSADDRAALLRDVRADKSRLQNLTPAERAYLVKRMGK